jgi:asparagine synthase (glutamine-hydrolysing)
MSAIYGVVNLDGAPVDPSEIEAMEAAIRHWGPDGGGKWIGGEAALGQLVLATTAESGFERGPLRLARSTFVAAGRLDNRDELAAELNLAPPGRAGLSESVIMAAAYEKWAEAAPARLLGDWAFAAWHPDERRLFIARDQLGITSLYYHFRAGRLAFASSRKALFALPKVPRRLNELRVAQHLTTWVVDGASTLHEGIFRVPPGNVLNAKGSAATLSRYWHPERVGEIALPSDEAYVERFLELYQAAVRTRMRSRAGIATTLSAGLDSGSVTALAAAEAGPRGETLLALTARPLFSRISDDRPAALVDEWPLAEEVAHYCGNLDHRPVLADGITPLQALRRSLELHDEPEVAASNLPWIQGMLEMTKGHGADVLLTGAMGNGTVSWSGDRQQITRLTLGRRPVAALRALRSWRTQRRISWPRALWHQVFAPISARYSSFAFRRGWRGQSASARSLVNPQFYARMRVAERMRDSGYDPFYSAVLPPLTQRLGVLLPEISPFGALWHECGAGYGIDIRDPTADLRLVEFCLAVPDEQYRVGGHDRSLIRRAMEGQLPPAVRWNRRRGMQGADIALRLAAHAGETEAALDTVAGSDVAREYLDVPGLRSRWTMIRADPVRVPLHEVQSFGRGLQFGLFLSQGL